MDDRALYATILGIAPPWEVDRVELDDEAKAVHVWLEARNGTAFTCPECQTISPLHDHVERSWRHLDNVSLRLASTPACRVSTAPSTA
jgi:transposase